MKKIIKKNKRTRTIKKKYGGKRVKLGITRKPLNKTKKLGNKNNITVRCSPKEKNKINIFSCYTDDALYKLRDLWNARHPDEIIQTNNTKEIHSKLTEYLSDVCNKESCWIKQKYDFGDVGDDIVDSFAPESPKEWKKNPNEWLSSVDIMKVMKQYEKAYKCFEFLGPTPIDFDTKKMYGTCVWEELCNFSLKDQLKSGKTKIGIIFNTDPHNKPGQHWISMFINIKKKQIFFFDSVGTRAPKEVTNLVDRIMEQGKQMNPKILFTFDENHPVEHQYGNSQCGIYSIFFIVHMLEDKITEHYLKTHILKDEYIAKFRKIYFNDSL